jgi:hypothetical protein
MAQVATKNRADSAISVEKAGTPCKESNRALPSPQAFMARFVTILGGKIVVWREQ